MTTVRSGTFSEQGTTSSVVVSKPSGAASGDKLIVFIGTEDSATVTCTTRPTGFTKVDGGTEADPVAIDTTGADMRAFCYEKTLGGSEGSTYTFTMSASTWVSWAAVCTNGASGAVLSTTSRTQASIGGIAQCSVSAVTLTAGQLGVAAGAGYENGALDSCTNWTEPTGSTRMGLFRTTTDATNEIWATAAGNTRWWSITLVLDAAGGGITGTSAVTLGAFTSTASGAYTPPAITGTVAVTLAAFTSTASGTVTAPGVTGTVAVTLAAFTSAASGTYTPPAITGTSATTLGVFVAAGSGTSSGPGSITGTVAVTLAAFTSSASGTVTAPTITGTSAVTLNPFLAVGTGTFTPAGITGTVAVTLGLFICVAASAAIGGVGAGTVVWRDGAISTIGPKAGSHATIASHTGTGEVTQP